MNDIIYIDRKTNKKQTEKVPGGKLLKFLYGGNLLGKLSLWILIKRKYFSILGGMYMDSKMSQKKIDSFVKDYQMNMDEYFIPKEGFKNFNEFFFRKIKPEFRPLGSKVVSPADGKILVFNSVSDTTSFFVKGEEFNTGSFLRNELLKVKYEQGSMAIIRLAPVDYHRYHFPVGGEVSENVKIKGAFYSVSPFALLKSLRIFCENKREYSTVSSGEFGDVLICDVGATLTGSIIQTYKANTIIEKGSEKGYFAFGGSTLVLLFEKGKIKFSEDLVSNTNNGFETTIKMGETITI